MAGAPAPTCSACPGAEQYAATGAVWTEELFVEYMANPTAFLREKLDDTGVRSPMSFRMRSGAEDMWAYLESVSPDSE